MRRGLLSKFTRYVLASVAGTLGLSLYILADTYFIANGIGSDGLAALNLAIPVYGLIHGTGLMLGIGAATRYSIEKSGNCSSNGDQTFSAALRLGLPIGMLCFGVGLLLSEPLARLLGANEDTLTMTATYLRTILCFSPLFILNNILIAFIRNYGSPGVAMTGMLAGSLSNILLDYAFIFPFGMGMFGAAFATGLAPIISIAAMSPYFIKGRHGFHLRRGLGSPSLYTDICSLGVSALVTEVASGVVLVVFNLLLLSLSGNIAVAAYGVIANLSLVAGAIFVGIGQGVQPLISHYYGAGKATNVRRLVRYAVTLSLGLASLIFAVVLLFGGNISDQFNRDGDEAFRAIAINGLSIYFSGFFFAGINLLLSAYFSAIEEPRTGFLIAVLRGCVVIVPLAIALSAIWGITGIWLAFPIAEAFVLAVGIAHVRALKQLPRSVARGEYGIR